MKRVGWIMLVVFLLTGCQTAFQGDEGGAHYIGRPGFLIEFKSGGFELYLGPDGNVTAKGTARISAGSEDFRKLVEEAVADVKAADRAPDEPVPAGDGG